MAINNAALLIVDVQHGFINEATSRIPSLVTQLQRKYQTVIATRFINTPDSPLRSLMGWHKFYPDTEDIELAFKPPEAAIILDKNVYTCVTTDLIHMLRTKGLDEVHVCGIDTDICVTKCAVDLFECGIRPVVLSAYCASHAGEQMHKAALQILARYIGQSNVDASPIDLNHPN